MARTFSLISLVLAAAASLSTGCGGGNSCGGVSTGDVIIVGTCDGAGQSDGGEGAVADDSNAP